MKAVNMTKEREREREREREMEGVRDRGDGGRRREVGERDTRPCFNLQTDNDLRGAGRSSEVERSLMVRWVVGSILHGVDPLSYFSFQPVLHDWCNKVRGLCYPVWDGAYKSIRVAGFLSRYQNGP